MENRNGPCGWNEKLRKSELSQRLVYIPNPVRSPTYPEPVHMPDPMILASASTSRARLLRDAAVAFEVVAARIDEESLKAALLAEAASPRDIADALAEMKARRVSARRPDAVVIGSDQVLDDGTTILSKPATPKEARAQIRALSGRTHQLISAVVLYQGGAPIWRHAGTARMTMRDISDRYLDDYVDRNWGRIRHSVGGYLIEEEGVRLFSRIEGDLFTVQGLPLLELLSYLSLRGIVPA